MTGWDENWPVAGTYASSSSGGTARSQRCPPTEADGALGSRGADRRCDVGAAQTAGAPRFLRWGKPVERLVAGHPAAVFSTAALRPPRTFSTFSIWRTVREMTEMVHGHSDVPEAETHAVAMVEQRRKDFHYESAFMRFRPLSEHGTWQGRRMLDIA